MTNTLINDATTAGTLTNNYMELVPIMTSESYTLFRRVNDGTYIVAYAVNTNFDAKTCTWASGHYLDRDFTKALEYFFERVGLRLRKINN